jgi:hypothetical protein
MNMKVPHFASAARSAWQVLWKVTVCQAFSNIIVWRHWIVCTATVVMIAYLSM